MDAQIDTLGRPIHPRTPRSREAAHRCPGCGESHWVDADGLVGMSAPEWSHTAPSGFLKLDTDAARNRAWLVHHRLRFIREHRLQVPRLPADRVEAMLAEVQRLSGALIDAIEAVELATRAGRTLAEDLPLAVAELDAELIDGAISDLRERWAVDAA